MLFNNNIKPSVSGEILNQYFQDYGFRKPICNAPGSSLYFFPDGEVGACCLNKTYYSYGHYPDDSINKIIRSKERKKHRKYLINNNFSLGCRECEENLNSGNFGGLLLNGLKNIRDGKRITKMDFELSHLCNFNCIMCHKDDNLVDTVYGDRFLDEIRPYLLTIKFATFIGGEPFLIPVYYKIWHIIMTQNKNCRMTVHTNGSILNEKIMNLARHPNFYIDLSLDSLREGIYSLIRKGGELSKTLKNFYFFNDCMKEKNHTMEISVCPMRLNWKEIPALVEFANHNQCSIFFNHVHHPSYLSLKYLHSSHLIAITEYYKHVLADLPDTTPLQTENRNRFNGLLNLLINWQYDASQVENDTLKICKDEIIGYLKPFRNEFDDLIQVVTGVLPETRTVTKRKYKEIHEFDFFRGLTGIMRMSEDKVRKTIRSFFEIDLYASDDDDFTP